MLNDLMRAFGASLIIFPLCVIVMVLTYPKSVRIWWVWLVAYGIAYVAGFFTALVIPMIATFLFCIFLRGQESVDYKGDPHA
ncbi:MAG TPA: hypothetical protein VN256_12925 [Pyrinomonadaceae bacterium]|nr:hypothetical protein [Pyrinomonadaceae bacterium]